MKLSVLAYGHGLLRQKCEYIDKTYPGLEILIQDMWETMQNAKGCGLAAPQIGQAIRLFIVDSKTAYQNLEEAERPNYFTSDDKGIMETFINARIIRHSEDCWEEEEGCLSVPNLFQRVRRHWSITIEYYDSAFAKQTQTFHGTTARIIQHEYDHTEGILHMDHLGSLTRKRMESRLKKIMSGQINPEYPMKFV